MDLGNLIKQHRKKMKLTQDDFGKKLNYDQSWVSKLENNSIVIDTILLDTISKILKIDKSILDEAYFNDLKKAKNKPIKIKELIENIEELTNLLEEENIITNKNLWNENINYLNNNIKLIKEIIKDLKIKKEKYEYTKNLNVEYLLLTFIKIFQKIYSKLGLNQNESQKEILESIIEFKINYDDFIILEYLFKKELDNENKNIIEFIKILDKSNLLTNDILKFHKFILNQTTNIDFQQLISIPYFSLINNYDFLYKNLEDFKIFISIIYTYNNRPYNYFIRKKTLFYEFCNDLININLNEIEENEDFIKKILNLNILKNKKLTKEILKEKIKDLKQIKNFIINNSTY